MDRDLCAQKRQPEFKEIGFLRDHLDDFYQLAFEPVEDEGEIRPSTSVRLRTRTKGPLILLTAPRRFCLLSTYAKR